MAEEEQGPRIRQIDPADADFNAALSLLLRSSLPGSADRYLDQIKSRFTAPRPAGTAPDLLLGAYDRRHLVSACLTLASPGGAGMVMIPSPVIGREGRTAALALLRRTQELIWAHPTALLELLVDPNEMELSRTLELAGFSYLTRLVYMRRAIEASSADRRPDPDLTWIPYNTENEPRFLLVLQETYSQSMDCPELTGIRPVADVLAGHKAVGSFDPTFWWIAERQGVPVGIILLNKILHESAVEVVYIGVACSARGTGVGDALISRAVSQARTAGDTCLALACDVRNRPALSLYRRWGFARTGERGAWIAKRPTPAIRA